jgi:hypothetical protein
MVFAFSYMFAIARMMAPNGAVRITQMGDYYFSGLPHRVVAFYSPTQDRRREPASVSGSRSHRRLPLSQLPTVLGQDSQPLSDHSLRSYRKCRPYPAQRLRNPPGRVRGGAGGPQRGPVSHRSLYPPGCSRSAGPGRLMPAGRVPPLQRARPIEDRVARVVRSRRTGTKSVRVFEPVCRRRWENVHAPV